MSLFDYKAKDPKGQVVTGLVEARDNNSALRVLQENELAAISIKPHGKSFLQSSVRLGPRVPMRPLVIFTRQLSVMVSATMPLVQAIRVIFNQTENRELKIILSQLADEIEGGTKLSAALGKHSDVFDDFFVNLIRSGETSGRLAETLNYLADEKEKDYTLNNKIIGAMIYPAFILSGLVVVGAIMMIFVVPKLTEVLKESGTDLPLSTSILIGVSEVTSNYWWVLAILAVAALIGIRSAAKTSLGKFILDRLKLKIPVFGKLFREIYIVRFTRSLQTLLVGKVPLTTALRVTSDVVGNAVFKRVISETVKEVEDGNSIATVLLTSEVVPGMVAQMMAIGEQTGRLDEILDKVSRFYSREIDNTVANLVTLIEPAVMVLMGVAVGGMVSAIILPTFSLANQL